MSVLGDPFTRWRHCETGELLVAIAAKEDGGVVLVLPVERGRAPHPLDWVSKTRFLRVYEQVSA